MADWDDMVLVGTVAKPHGLRGHVVVNPETDFVEERFQPGAVLWIRAGEHPEPLVVESMRVQNGRPVVAFTGYPTVDASQSLLGRQLRIPEEALQPLAEGEYYRHQLVGCRVVTEEGDLVGSVRRVDDGASGSLLTVDGASGEVLIPFASDICVSTDVDARVIVVNPPEGLLEVNVPERRTSSRRLKRKASAAADGVRLDRS